MLIASMPSVDAFVNPFVCHLCLLLIFRMSFEKVTSFWTLVAIA
jgi:hypothetical protein